MSYTLEDLYEGLQLFRQYTEDNMPFKQTSFFGTANPTSGAGFAAPLGAFYILTDVGKTLVTDIFYKQQLADTGWVKFLNSSMLGQPNGVTPLNSNGVVPDINLPISRLNIFDTTGVVSQSISASDATFNGGCTGFINVKVTTGGSYIFYRLELTKSGASSGSGLFELLTINATGYTPPNLPVNVFISPRTDLIPLNDTSRFFNLLINTDSKIYIPFQSGGTSFSHIYEGSILVPVGLSSFISI